MIEFTGERVVPGQVEPDLWNEHYVRYLFASRLSRARWVADLGCGTGYGSALLARGAAEVHAIDVAPEAIAYAREHNSAPNLHFAQASCTALPFAPESFDLVVAFEVIEHLENWNDLLAEAARVLAPGGQCVVSTPNLSYYAATREQSGPNPFHAHEFTYEEFRTALLRHFPDVRLFAQNHVAGLAIQPLESSAGSELRIDGSLADPDSCHFFLAVCARSPQMGAPVYVYIPRTANVLQERERHIDSLSLFLKESQAAHQELLVRHESLQAELEERNRWAEGLTLSLQQKEQQHADLVAEIEGKNQWARELEDRIAQAAARIRDLELIEAERDSLIERSRRQTEEIEAKNRWALDLEARIAPLETEIARLGQELESSSSWAQSLDTELAQLRASLDPILADRDEAHRSLSVMADQAATLERELESRTAWVHSLDAQFQAKSQELARCIELLERAEATVVERTEWAQRAQSQVERLLADIEAARSEAAALRERIGLVAGSRWLKLGRTIGVGPRIEGGARS